MDETEDNNTGFVPNQSKRDLIRAGIVAHIDKLAIWRPNPPEGEPEWIVQDLDWLEQVPLGVEAGRKMPPQLRMMPVELKYLESGGMHKTITSHIYARIERGKFLVFFTTCIVKITIAFGTNFMNFLPVCFNGYFSNVFVIHIV